jgi:hypothetical protein
MIAWWEMVELRSVCDQNQEEKGRKRESRECGGVWAQDQDSVTVNNIRDQESGYPR